MVDSDTFSSSSFLSGEATVLFVVYGPLPPVKDQAVGHYFEALRLNQEQSMEFVLVIIQKIGTSGKS